MFSKQVNNVLPKICAYKYTKTLEICETSATSYDLVFLMELDK